MLTEMSSPGLVRPDERTHLTGLLAARTSAKPDSIFAETKDDAGNWHPVTLAAFHTQVRAVAKGLVARGVQPGDRVGIMGDTRYEWAVVDFAALAAGAVTVPIYPSSSPEQVAYILSDAGATLAA